MHDDSTFHRAMTFIGTHGLGDVLVRMEQEIRTPTTPLGRRLLPMWRFGRAAWTRLRGSRPVFDEQTLAAFYDLNVSPITFDFAWFLIAADLERRRRGLERLHVVIVPGDTWKSGPESEEYLALVDAPARRQRVFDILIPLREMLSTPGGITFSDNRSDPGIMADSRSGHVFPARYTPALPFLAEPFPGMVTAAAKAGEAIPSFKAPSAARQWVERWRTVRNDRRPLVTITLRESAYQPGRNSNIEAWAALAEELHGEGFSVVVIPETHLSLGQSATRFSNVTICPEAAWNVALRGAFYEEAYLNLGVNTGPMALAWLNRRTRYITFKMVADDEPGTCVDFQLSLGVDPRKPFPFATPFQKLCLASDDLPTLRQEIADMRKGLDQGMAEGGP